MSQRKFFNYSTGFSLIELMAAVIIVGILSAIAIPSYQAHVRSANRAQAQAGLIQLAAAIEQFKTRNPLNSYAGATLTAENNNIFPSFISSDGITPLYNLTLSNLGRNTYTLVAAPVANADFSFSLSDTGLKQRCPGICAAGAAGWVNGWNVP